MTYKNTAENTRACLSESTWFTVTWADDGRMHNEHVPFGHGTTNGHIFTTKDHRLDWLRHEPPQIGTRPEQTHVEEVTVRFANMRDVDCLNLSSCY